MIRFPIRYCPECGEQRTIMQCAAALKDGKVEGHEPTYTVVEFAVSRPVLLSELELVVKEAAGAMDDLLQMLGVNPAERQVEDQHGIDIPMGATIGETLAGAAVRGALDHMYKEKPDE